MLCIKQLALLYGNLIMMVYYYVKYKVSSLPHYIYWDGKLLASAHNLLSTLLTGLWAVWAEQHTPHTQFLPRPARKVSNVPKLKSS